MRKWTLVLMLSALGGGCAQTEQKPSNMRARQDEALRDPFNYNPNAGDRTDISGGGVTDFKPDAFMKDVNSAFSP